VKLNDVPYVAIAALVGFVAALTGLDLLLDLVVRKERKARVISQ
jgi:hypothetical protein